MTTNEKMTEKNADNNLTSLKEAVTRFYELEEVTKTLPDFIQYGKRLFVFYENDGGDVEFCLPIWEKLSVKENDAFVNLFTNKPSDKACWKTISEVVITSNLLHTSKYTLRIGDKHLTDIEAIKALPIYAEVSKANVFTLMASVTSAVSAEIDSTLLVDAKGNLIDKYVKRGKSAKASAEVASLPENVTW